MFRNLLVRLIGWRATVLHGDPSTFDRWRWLKKHLQPGALRTIDIGCGSGAFTIYASKIGNEAIGISCNERNNNAACLRAKILGIKNIQFIQTDLGRLEEVAHGLGTFEQVICFEAIEHIINDQKLISDISSLLKPGGRLLLTTPYRYHRPLFGENPERMSKIEDGWHHVRWGYSCDEIKSIFRKAGIRPEREDYISGVVSQKLIDTFRILSKLFPFSFAWAIILPFRILQIIDRPLTRALNYPYLSIAVIGVK